MGDHRWGLGGADMSELTARLRSLAISKKTPYQQIETSFLLERMVARLVEQKELENKIIFKGGYVGLRVFESPRFTTDLDALIKGAQMAKIVSLAKDAVTADIIDGTWFVYEKRADLQTLGQYGGVRLYFRRGIGEPPKNVKTTQMIHLDLATGDVVVPSPVKLKTKSMLGKDSLSWQVYTIESATAEKLHGLIVRHSDNSRSKDVFDLYNFLPKCNLNILCRAISATFKARKDTLPAKLSPVVAKIDTDLLERGWRSATATLKDKPKFDHAFERILLFCKRMDGRS